MGQMEGSAQHVRQTRGPWLQVRTLPPANATQTILDRTAKGAHIVPLTRNLWLAALSLQIVSVNRAILKMMRGVAASPCALQESIPVLRATPYVTQTDVLRAVSTVAPPAWIATIQTVPVGFAQERIFGQEVLMIGNVCREVGFAAVLLRVLMDAMTVQQTAIQPQAAML